MAGLVNMFPENTVNNTPDGVLGNAKDGGDVFLFHALTVKHANLLYIRFSQFCLSVLSAGMIFATAFIKHVGVIVGFRTEKQMGGIYASAVIAAMQNAKSCVKNSIHDLVSNAVSFSLARFRQTKNTIAIVISTRSPIPTGIGFINFGPEPLGCFGVNHNLNYNTVLTDKRR